MCPACIATALMIAGSVVSTGGLVTIAVKKFGMKNALNQSSNTVPSKEERHG